MSELANQSSLFLSQFCDERQGEMLAALQQAVELESPSDDKAAVDLCGTYLAREFTRLGAKVSVHRQERVGNHLKAEFPGRAGAKPLLLLGHFDTVWPLGTLAKMPFRVDNGRAYGPGDFDMKAG